MNGAVVVTVSGGQQLARHGVSVRFTDTPPLDDDPQAKLLTLWGSRSRPELVTCGDRRSTLQD